MKVVRLSALRNGRRDSIGNRTRDLPVCKAVPRPTRAAPYTPIVVCVIKNCLRNGKVILPFFSQSPTGHYFQSLTVQLTILHVRNHTMWSPGPWGFREELMKLLRLMYHLSDILCSKRKATHGDYQVFYLSN